MDCAWPQTHAQAALFPREGTAGGGGRVVTTGASFGSVPSSTHTQCSWRPHAAASTDTVLAQKAVPRPTPAAARFDLLMLQPPTPSVPPRGARAAPPAPKPADSLMMLAQAAEAEAEQHTAEATASTASGGQVPEPPWGDASQALGMRSTPTPLADRPPPPHTPPLLP